MSEQIKLVNVFDQRERKIVCIKNEHDYLGDGTIFKENELEVGKEYTYVKGEAQSYGMMVYLKEASNVHGYGFQSYLFEEIEGYDKQILKDAYENWLISELDKAEKSVKEGRYISSKELRRVLDGKYDNSRKKLRRVKRLKRKQGKQ